MGSVQYNIIAMYMLEDLCMTTLQTYNYEHDFLTLKGILGVFSNPRRMHYFRIELHVDDSI